MRRGHIQDDRDLNCRDGCAGVGDREAESAEQQDLGGAGAGGLKLSICIPKKEVSIRIGRDPPEARSRAVGTGGGPGNSITLGVFPDAPTSAPAAVPRASCGRRRSRFAQCAVCSAELASQAPLPLSSGELVVWPLQMACTGKQNPMQPEAFVRATCLL